MSNLTKRARTYIAACPDGDCRLKKTDLRRINRSQTHSAHYICKQHLGIVYAIEFAECDKCKKPFSVIPKSGFSKRSTCDICKSKEEVLSTKKKEEVEAKRIEKKLAKEKKAAEKTVTVKQKKAVEEKIKRATEKHNAAQMRRAEYCSWMKSCISNGVLRCDGCRKFEGVFFGYDPGVKCA